MLFSLFNLPFRKSYSLQLASIGLRLFSVAALMASLTGCGHLGNWVHNGFKVGPDYSKPAVSVADDWIEFNNPKVISDSYGVENQAWWGVFQDEQINQLVDETYEQNLTLRAASMRVLEAEAERAIAVGLMFPQFQEGFGEYSRVQISRNETLNVGLPFRNFSNWNTGFRAAWELDVWGRYRRAIEAADSQLDATVENYDDILTSLLAETAATYVEIRGFQERIAYAEANIKTQEKNLQLAEIRFDAKDVSKLDVTEARSSLELTRSLVPTLESGLRQANNRLCILLGLPTRDLIPQLGVENIPSTPRDVVVGIPADLIRRRPDLRRAEREVAAQSALIGIAVSDLFPAFTINGSINWSAADFSDIFRSSSNGGLIGPSFNWNLLNYGRLVNNVRVQDARFQQLAIDYQQQVLKANAEVEDAIIFFLKSQEAVASLQASVDANAESVRLASIQYREGAITFDRVNNMQRDLTQVQDQLAVAETNVALGLIQTYRALGGGWQIRLGASPNISIPAPAEPPAEPIPPAPDPV
ncbi:MAG: TolC family protein [Planctomycetaceae bacterium]|nr:TolC family protein [Planctomycetaceae bacterium]